MKLRKTNFVAFDLGSSKISAVAAHVTKQEIEINAQTMYASGGLKSGVITDMELAESSIVGTIYALEKNCDKSIKEAAISLSGAHTKSYYISQSVKISGQVVLSSDIKKLITKALAQFKEPNKEIIHYFPIEFKIDGHQVVDNPIDLCAKEVSCQLHIIAAESTMIMNLARCFAKHQVQVSNMILGVYASALSTLQERELEMGAVIIDMGANTTSYAVISKGKPIYTNYVPLGGEDITVNIARKLSISLSAAEKLKILHGTAAPKMIIKDSVLEIEGETRTITTMQLAQIIWPIIEEIFTNINNKLKELSLDHLISNQIVITGGGGALSEITPAANQIFNKQIRVANLENISGFIESYNPLLHASLFGMLKFKMISLQNKYSKDYTESNNWFSRILSWLKNNI